MAFQVKICGIRDAATLEVAVAHGADLVGFVFYPPSPRALDIFAAAELTASVPDHVGAVGLLVDPDDRTLDGLLAHVSLDILQLHGEETPERVAAIREHTGCRVMKALRIREKADLELAAAYASAADLLMLDAKPPVGAVLPGGNGVAFDWALAADFRFSRPWALAGGLKAENLAAAVQATEADIYDVSSGVESAPGVKDPAKVQAFLAKAAELRDAFPEEVSPMTLVNSYRAGPDERGRFGIYGGRFVAETLMPLILELEQAYRAARTDPSFQAELDAWLKDYVGRPSPLYFAERLTEHLRGAKIYFKRDELNHTGAHKINNCIGQIMLARRMGKTRIIAETGAGQHGVATATVAARFGLPCVIYMGEVDIARQQPNVFRMRLLGAEVRPVASGSKTLKDAMNEALRDWVTNVHDTFYIIGSVAGPHPYPAMVRDFQAVIGTEAKQQILEKEGRLPDALVAAVGGGSNAMGLFFPFLDDREVRIVAVEAAGDGIETGRHAAAMTAGTPGVLHGSRSYLLQDEDGQVIEPHSISAGLDYPGIGPEHSWLKDMGRIEVEAVTDKEALQAFQLCSALEGILPALEPAHALAQVAKLAPTLPRDDIVVMNLCGRGDKDIFTVAQHLGVKL